MKASWNRDADFRVDRHGRRRFAWIFGVLCLGLTNSAEFIFAGSYISVFDYGKLGDWSRYQEYHQISPDGQHAIGLNFDPDFPSGAYGVFHNGSFAPVIPPDGVLVSQLSGLSDNGNVVIFNGLDTATWNSRAYRVENGVAEDLGYLYAGENRGTSAWAMSANGRVVTGTSYLLEDTGGVWNFYSSGYVWSNGVMTALESPVGKLSSVNAITADGTKIVGTVYDTVDFVEQAAVWENGVFSLLPGLSAGETVASDVSDDGTTVVGYSEAGGGTYHLVRWVNGQVEQLSATPYVSYTMAASSSGDGNLLVLEDKVWKQGLGLTTAERYLGYHRGLYASMSGYLAWSVNDISPDGRYFTGLAVDENYWGWGYIAYLDPADFAIPEPSTFWMAGMAAVGLLWARRRSRDPKSNRGE